MNLGPFRTNWDEEAQAGYIYLVPEIKDGEAVRQIELAPNVIADYDKDNRLLGIEFLGSWAANLESDNE